MGTTIRHLIGGLLAITGVVALALSVRALLGHDYIAAILGVLAGLGLCGSGVELLRPAVGE